MIHIFQDKNQLSQAAAEIFIASAQEAISQKGKFTVALTGGSSPAILYALLSEPENRAKIDWKNTFVFWGDERWVPISDEKSNAGAAFESFLNKIDIPSGNIFPMWKADIAPEKRAEDYEEILREHLGESGEFDLILSGMGDDGHTASLFPGTAVLHEKTKWVAAYFLEPQDMFRITLTAPLLNRAKKNVVLVFGANKAQAFTEVISGERNPEKYPSQLLAPEKGELLWMVDEAAAAGLPSDTAVIRS